MKSPSADYSAPLFGTCGLAHARKEQHGVKTENLSPVREYGGFPDLPVWNWHWVSEPGDKTSARANGTMKDLINNACRKTLGYTTLLCGLALVPPPLACARRKNFEVYSELPRFTLYNCRQPYFTRVSMRARKVSAGGRTRLARETNTEPAGFSPTVLSSHNNSCVCDEKLIVHERISKALRPHTSGVRAVSVNNRF